MLKRTARLARIFVGFMLKRFHLGYLPFRYWIETTNKCNLSCVLCPNSADNTSIRGLMDIEIYRRLIDDIQRYAYDINLSHRGEPLFHPQLYEFISYAENKGIATRIHTNATMLDAEKSEMLIDSGLSLLSFSFDGFDKEGYEAIRRGSDYEMVVCNIVRFLEMKARKNKGPYTIIQVIETIRDKYKTEQKEAFMARFKGLPVDKFYIKKPHSWAGNVKINDFMEDPQQVDDSLKRSRCTFPWYASVVLWDGTVCPCPQDWYGEMKMGDLNQYRFPEIWNGEAYQELRSIMNQGRQRERELCWGCDRITRPTLLGIPLENLKPFLGESLLGYHLVSRLIKR